MASIIALRFSGGRSALISVSMACGGDRRPADPSSSARYQGHTMIEHHGVIFL